MGQLGTQAVVGEPSSVTEVALEEASVVFVSFVVSFLDVTPYTWSQFIWCGFGLVAVHRPLLVQQHDHLHLSRVQQLAEEHAEVPEPRTQINHVHAFVRVLRFAHGFLHVSHDAIDNRRALVQLLGDAARLDHAHPHALRERSAPLSKHLHAFA
jgi:hypothetical protein